MLTFTQLKRSCQVNINANKFFHCIPIFVFFVGNMKARNMSPRRAYIPTEIEIKNKSSFSINPRKLIKTKINYTTVNE